MKVVLCHGVFDLLHVGHLEHLKQARAMGDFLIVSVVPDKYATKRKPIYDEKARVKLLKALRCVDCVVLCAALGPEKIIRQYEPDIYVRGPDYKGKKMPESALLEQLGIHVRYTKPPTTSTSDIITRILRR